MRTAIYLFIIAGLISSCANNKTEDEKPVIKAKTFTALAEAPQNLKGTYVGDFKGSPIAITLNYVGNNHASGYNVHKGLKRNISGTIEATNNGLHLLLEEPGNNQYDGKFDITIDTTKWTGKGTWNPFKEGKEASFTLRKQVSPNEEDMYANTFMDSLQNYITLKPDGSCTYTYLTDTTNTGQLVTIQGNYTKEKTAYTIFWQKNEVFPQKSVFKLIETRPNKEEDYVEKSLKGEGRLFTQMWD